MAWAYKSFSVNSGSTSAQQVIDQMAGFIAGLNPAVAATAKTGLTDQHHGPSFGVIFYSNSAPTSPPAFPTGAWTQYTVTTGSNSQYDQDFQTIQNMLNGISPSGVPTLGQTQAYYAHFCMSDYESGSTNMALFFPNV